VRRLLSEARPEASSLAIGTFFLLISSLANLALPKVAGGLIDTCSKAASGELPSHEAFQQLNFLLYISCGILAVGGFAGGIRSYLFSAASERVMCRLRSNLFSRLVIQEVAFFDTAPVGELSNRLSEDTRAIKEAATTSISMALRSLVTCLLGLILMFLTSWQLALMTCATLPITLISFRIFAKLNKRYVTQQLAASASATALAQEALTGIRTVKSFAKEHQAVQRYSSAIQQVLLWGLKSSAAVAVFTGFVLPVATGLLMVVLWYGSREVLSGAITLGNLNTFMLYAIFVAGSASGLAGTAAQVVSAVGAGRRVFQLMDRNPRLPPAGNSKPSGSPLGASLDLINVAFSYPSRPSIPILSGFNLSVKPGQKVALVGPSGGGKSTVVRLALRFYDPQEGSVLLDGVPVSDIDHGYLHQQIALVAQEPVVFADTILYNIMFGLHDTSHSSRFVSPAADGSVSQVSTASSHVGATAGDTQRQHSAEGTEGLMSGAFRSSTAAASSSTSQGTVPPSDAVIAAAKAAHAHEFIMALPKGYNSLVGQQGVMLSGGQKQRLAIARALLTEPRLLLLDEATSALDAESEHLVQEALQEAACHRSVLVIAHRLSTVTGADVVAVVEGGRVVESGTHGELVGAGGVYSQLVRRQVFAADVREELDTITMTADIMTASGSAVNGDSCHDAS
jgi:ABC-type multidrug transport system fused ATPase/permease subunit